MRAVIRTSFVSAAVALLMGASAARAQDDESTQNVIDVWAEAMVEAMARSWEGPHVEWPAAHPRPESAGVLRSFTRPVNVHPGPRVSATRAATALAAIEGAHAYMEAHDWPLPGTDGGAGDTAGFDLYLMPGEPQPGRPIHVSYDAPTAYGILDGVVPWVRVDDEVVSDSRLESCVISAYAQAALLMRDPAEAEAWRVATGDYLAWLLTGHFGCDDRGVVRQQRESWRTWVGPDAESGEGGALFLAMLSARTDGASGDFIRDLWSAAPQHTFEGDQLRAAPDMWQVVNAVMDAGEDPLLRFIEEIAVTRYFAGSAQRRRSAPLGVLRELGEDAAVPLAGHARFDQLPRRFEPHGLELEPYGSAYLEIDTSMAEAGSLLRVWLRGELGVGWALSVVRLGADGSERGRVRTPVQMRNPHSYVPLELTDDQTAKVVIVVTNMGARLMDADDPHDMVRSFSLVLDVGADDRE